jgi:hypothetical protein
MSGKILRDRRHLAWNLGPLGYLKMSKFIWKDIVTPGSIVIDATCGNGHDSSFLGKLCLAEPGKGSLYCIDIQQQAIDSTKKKLSSEFTTEMMERIKFVCASHEAFPSEIPQSSVSLVVYNLGYLPGVRGGKDERLKTRTLSTMASLRNAIPLISENGLISITTTPGHEGGTEEMENVNEMLKSLDPSTWRVHAHRSLNSPRSPHLFLVYRIGKQS